MSARSIAVPILAALTFAACSSPGPVGTDQAMAPSFALIPPPPGPNPDGEQIVVCKVGGSGSYDFTASHGNTPFSLTPGQCWHLGYWGGAGISATITELPKTGHVVDSIKVVRLVGATQVVTGTNSVTGVAAAGNPAQSAVVTFYNSVLPPPPPGDQGCTPGYWKNHRNSWQGYTTGQTAGSVFTIPGSLSSLASNSLLATLGGGGGSGLSGAAKILLRAATAAVLNAQHSGVAYPRTVADIISDVNAALATGERSVVLALATELDNDNNLGCPLN